MRDNLIPAFLASVGSKPISTSEKVVTGPCPLAPYTHESGKDKHPSFGIFRGQGAKGHCFACGFSGELLGLVIRLRDFEKKHPSGRLVNFAKALELLELQASEDPLIPDDGTPPIDEQAFIPPGDQVSVWPESYMAKFEDAYTETEVHPYLASRAISCTTARRLDLKWDWKEERICFPIRDFHGRLCGVHGRTIHSGVEPKYRVYLHAGASNQTVWLGEHWLDFDRSVVVVESVFDLAAVYSIYPNVITLRSANFPLAALKRLDGATHVVTLSDNDKAGAAFCAHIEKLKGTLVEHASVAPYKDPGEAGEDGHEGQDLLRSRLAQYVSLDENHLVKALPF